jgi:UDP-glucose 4-epimerase
VNILVTGGLGVNGCWVTRQLLEMGHRPVVYDNRPDFSLLPDLAGKVELVVADVLDFPTLVRTIRDHHVERICHLAAMYPGPADADPVLGFQVNALSTVYMLEAARTMGLARVVFTSSVGALSRRTAEYGHPTYKPLSEDYPAYPAGGGVYSACKVASELMGQFYQRKYGVEFVALRYASIFGLGKKAARHGDHDKLYTQLVENAMLGRPTGVPHGGDEKQDMTYARDVAHSVVLACFAPKPQHQVFHIGSGRGYTIKEFAAAVKQVYPKAAIEVGAGLDPRGYGPTGYYIFDISRARKELGYSPQFDLAAAVKDWTTWMGRLELEPSPWPERAEMRAMG